MLFSGKTAGKKDVENAHPTSHPNYIILLCFDIALHDNVHALPLLFCLSLYYPLHGFHLSLPLSFFTLQAIGDHDPGQGWGNSNLD